MTYGFMTLGAFAIVTVVRDAGGEATHLSRWAGLGKESPVLAGVFAFFLLGMAGIPLTAGFTGKWAVFASAVSAGAWPVVVVAVLVSAVAAFFYVRVIVLMYFSDPVGDGPSVTVPSLLTTIDDRGRLRRDACSWASCPGRCSTWRPMRASSSGERLQRLAAGLAPAGPRRRPSTSGLTRADGRGRGRARGPRDAARRRSSPRRPGTCWTPAASGSGRCWCCWPPRPATPPRTR